MVQWQIHTYISNWVSPHCLYLVCECEVKGIAEHIEKCEILLYDTTGMMITNHTVQFKKFSCYIHLVGHVQVNITYLLTGYEDHSKFIVPRDSSYFSGKAKGNGCFWGENKLAFLQIVSK